MIFFVWYVLENAYEKMGKGLMPPAFYSNDTSSLFIFIKLLHLVANRHYRYTSSEVFASRHLQAEIARSVLPS
jgi:hypothetical protein